MKLLLNCYTAAVPPPPSPSYDIRVVLLDHKGATRSVSLSSTARSAGQTDSIVGYISSSAYYRESVMDVSRRSSRRRVMSLLATTGPPVTLLKGRSHMRRAVMRRALPRFASKNTRRVLPAQRSNARRMFEAGPLRLVHIARTGGQAFPVGGLPSATVSRSV